MQGMRLTRRRHFGVPYGGPWDRESLALANALVGNEEDAAALEMPMFGGRFTTDSKVRIAIVGAVGPVLINGEGMSPNAAYTLQAGDQIEIGPYSQGSVAYLATSGGFVAHMGVSVKRGDTLQARNGSEVRGTANLKLDSPPKSLDERAIRVTKGPQYDIINGQIVQRHSILADRNRMGTRLSGDPVQKFEEIASEPACWGAIQITRTGERIIIGPDGPTIGGYPKIAVVIDADLDRIAQLREGEVVSLTYLEREKAAAISATAQSELEKRVKLIRTLVQ